MHATKGAALTPAEIGTEGRETDTTSCLFTAPSTSRQDSRQEWRERAFATLAILRDRFPACFAPAGQNHRWPLKVGVHRDIDAEAPDLTPAAVGAALSFYVQDSRYLKLMTAGRARIGLDGKAAGPVVSESDAAGAAATLARRQGEKKIETLVTPEAPKPKPITLAALKEAALKRRVTAS
jgi:sRNA-binding protein